MGKIPIKTIIEKYGSEEAYKEHLRKQLSGKHFYTNGIEDRKFSDDEQIPEGWWRGRTNSGKGTKGQFFINNGKIQTSIKEGTPIPDGWTKGALPLSMQHKENISKALKNHTKTQEHCMNISISHKTDEYKEKIANTNLKKYGVPHAAQADEIKKKTRKLFIDKYDINNPMQLPEIQKKHKQACLEHFGVEYPLQCSKVKEKRKQNNAAKYGVECTLQTQEAKEKSKQTCIKRYGVPYASQSVMIQQKISNTIQERYGVMWGLQMLHTTPNDSSVNIAFANKLQKANIDYEREFPLDKYRFDFKVGNILIELDPYPTHNSLWGIYGEPKDTNYHQQKSQIAEQQGYQVIHIFDWDCIDKIINLLITREKIYARKCIVKMIDIKECNRFLDIYHLQNSCRGQKVCLGLYYNNELVSIMTFGKPRYNKNYEWELLRYCSKAAVIGGNKKLFSYFINQYNPKSIISYCDRAKFRGDIYNTLGFTLQNKGRPSKHWYNPQTKHHITNNLLLMLGFDNLFNTNYGKGTNNEELIINEGYIPIYDCGQDTYIYDKK